MTSASKTVLVPLGKGSEEMEAVTIIDVLRRAGAEVTVASVERDLTVECSRQVKIVADRLIHDVAETSFDIIVLPVRLQPSLVLVRTMFLQTTHRQLHSSNLLCRGVLQDLKR